MSVKKILTTIFILLLCSLAGFLGSKLILENAVANEEVGWTEKTQQRFYFADRGSQLMPYDWFLALEPSAYCQQRTRHPL